MKYQNSVISISYVVTAAQDTGYRIQDTGYRLFVMHSARHLALPTRKLELVTNDSKFCAIHILNYLLELICTTCAMYVYLLVPQHPFGTHYYCNGIQCEGSSEQPDTLLTMRIKIFLLTNLIAQLCASPCHE